MTGSEAGNPDAWPAPFRRRLRLILTSGLTPPQLAATCCIGIAVGVMPLLAGTTLLCIPVAARLRLNQLVLQAVNYLVYPLQLALFIPFFRLGDRLLQVGPPIPAHLLKELASGGIGTAAGLFGWITLKALIAWLITIAPLMLIIYWTLKMVMAQRG